MEEALRHSVLPETVFVTQAARGQDRVEALLEHVEAKGGAVCELSSELMQEVSDAQTPQGLVGIVPAPSLSADVFSGTDPWLLVIDRVQDPGNLGTLCRTALAAGVSGVVLLHGTVDPGNPKVIRSSAGAMFGLRMVHLSAEHLVTRVQEAGVRLITADLSGQKSLYDVSWHGAVALLVGNEASGPMPYLKQNSNEIVRIPMPGPVESLNVSVASALCLFEGVRQRYGA